MFLRWWRKAPDDEGQAAAPRYRADRPGALPTAVTPVVGGVALPPGRAIVPDPSMGDGDADPAATPLLWISDAPVRNPGKLWRDLARGYPEHGLWPVVLASLKGQEDRPWAVGELAPSLSTPPDSHDPSAVLARWWGESIPVEDEGEDLEYLAPFGRRFPGLAPASGGTARVAAPGAAAAGLRGHIGLVPATRPADVPSAIGWQGPVNHFADMGLLSAVLRSWEDRFGAYLVGLGFDTMELGVQRPPRHREEALAIAAEHSALCPDCIQQGSGTIGRHAGLLVGAEAWSFWWD